MAGSYTMYSNIEFNEIWGCECGGCVEWGSLSFTKQKPPRTQLKFSELFLLCYKSTITLHVIQMMGWSSLKNESFRAL